MDAGQRVVDQFHRGDDVRMQKWVLYLEVL